MRRLCVVSAVLLASTLHLRSQTPQPPQGPVFRAGTTLVQVDAIVTDPTGAPVVDLQAPDFEMFDDGKPVPIASVRLLGAAAAPSDEPLAPIRNRDDEEREASKDEVRVFAIFLDDYHVRRMEERGVIEPLLEFVRKLPATDLVGVYYPLDSMTDVNFVRDREPALKAIQKFYGRAGDYLPTRPVEEEHLRRQDIIERIRQEITEPCASSGSERLSSTARGTGR